MALSLKDPEADRLAREVAERTGETITAAIGPPDFKVLLSRDFLRGINRFGFDVLYGQPIPFNRLVLKGSPDHGQLGGI